MSDQTEAEYLVTGAITDVVIDIGEDGGELKITQTVPPVYEINGRVVNEAAADAWIRHWHAIRDLPFKSRCTCDPCVRTRKLHGV